MTVATLNYNQTLPLTMAKLGQIVKLVQIVAGRKLIRRLTDLGLTPGIEMQVIQDQGGPLILGVRDSRIVMGRGMAHRIMVQNPSVSACAIQKMSGRCSRCCQ